MTISLSDPHPLSFFHAPIRCCVTLRYRLMRMLIPAIQQIIGGKFVFKTTIMAIYFKRCFASANIMHKRIPQTGNAKQNSINTTICNCNWTEARPPSLDPGFPAPLALLYLTLFGYSFASGGEPKTFYNYIWNLQRY